MQKLLFLFLLSCLLITCSQTTSADAESGKAGAKSAVTTFYLSRHAEKASGEDPGLLPAGQARAERIARKLGKEKVAAVYATGYRRTQETATPLAKAAGLSVNTYDAGKSASVLIDELLARHKGQTVFIVGHSNTVPDLVNALAGEKRYGDIDESVYDHLFKVTVGTDGRGKITELSSGK